MIELSNLGQSISNQSEVPKRRSSPAALITLDVYCRYGGTWLRLSLRLDTLRHGPYYLSIWWESFPDGTLTGDIVIPESFQIFVLDV